MLRLVSAATIAAVLPMYAPLGRGTIFGTAADPSGTPILGAVVVVTNTGTNVPFQTTTNSEGFYATPGLLIGAYSVIVEAPGFKKSIRTGIALGIDQRAEVNVRLEIGAVSDSVEVNSAAVLLDTGSATAGKVIAERELLDLPLNGRNAFSMMVLTPGVNNNANPVNAGFGARGLELADTSINGGAAGFNNFTIDGANNSNTVLNELNANPAVDAIAEFKVQSGTMSAEYGFTLGGVVNVATKSGTNAYHGTLYEFLRYDAFDARNAFALTKPFLRYNQYGGTLSGPVRIPKIYDGRNRTFLFYNYEAYTRRDAPTSFTTVPTPEERSGDFGQTKTAQGALISIYDPMTTVPNPNATGYVRTPFPGNVIPPSRFDPLTLKILSVVALPNATPISPFTTRTISIKFNEAGC